MIVSKEREMFFPPCYVLKKRGIRVTIQGVGTVKSQSIAPGTAVTKGQKIKLVLD